MISKAGRASHDRDVYMNLVAQFPLRPIRSERDLDRAIEMVNSLIDRESRSPAEDDYLDVLSDLVERYEEQRHPISRASDPEILRFLIESKGVSQIEVARKNGIAKSTVSDVLAGRRKLTRAHIEKLAEFFHVSPSVFALPK